MAGSADRLSGDEAISDVEAKMSIKDALLPRLGERWASAFSVKYEALDQIDTLIIEDTITRTGGDELDVFRFVPNPDTFSWKVELSFDLGKLFVSPGELKSAYAFVAKQPGWFDLESHRVEGNPVDFFAGTRTRDWVKRFLSGVKVTGPSSQATPTSRH